jgi:hypothetical protein
MRKYLTGDTTLARAHLASDQCEEFPESIHHPPTEE